MTLSIEEFGDALLRTGDLDPVYTAIAGASLDLPTLNRLCLAYWCFYHLGAAAKIAENKQPAKFWAAMQAAAINTSLPDGSKPWPRGSERRHFRGELATSSVDALQARYRDATWAVRGMVGVVRDPMEGVGLAFKGVSAAVQSHKGFGPWIAFKIADMAERVLGYEVDFSDCALGIYKDPRQGAAVAFYTSELAAGRVVGTYAKTPWDFPISDATLSSTVDKYVSFWRKKRAKAPPRFDRLVNVQEIETIFCKYKSHLKGHYPVGKDTAEVWHGLQGWGDLAQQLSKGMPYHG